MSQIPIYERRVGFDAKSVRMLNNNVVQELDAIADSSLKMERQVLDLKLKNDLMSFQNFAQDNIDKAYDTFKNDPDGLNKQFSQLNKSVISALPYSLRAEGQLWFNQQTRGYVQKAKTNLLNLENSKLTENSLKIATKQGAAFGEMGAELFSSNASQQAAAAETLGSKYAELERTVNQLGADGQPIFTPLQRVTMVNNAINNALQSGVISKFNSLNTVEEKIKFKNDFEQGNIELPISKLVDPDGKVNPKTRMDAKTYRRLVSSMEKGIKDFSGNQLFNNVLLGSAEPDPANKDYVDSANNHYETVLRPALKNDDPDTAAVKMLEYIKTTQVVPSMMIRELKAWNDAEDPKKLITAAKFINTAKESYPLALISMNENQLAKAFTLAEDLASGMAPKFALDHVNKLYSPKDALVYQAREKAFIQLARNEDLNFRNMAQQALTPKGWFQTKPKFDNNTIMPEQAQMDYANLYKAGFVITNDKDKAKELADIQFRLRWGTTTVNSPKGEKMMFKYPPELFYSIEGRSPNWIRDQLIGDATEEVKRMGLDGYLPETAILFPDGVTETEALSGQEPTYQIMVKNQYGDYEILGLSANEIIRWKPSTSIELKRTENANN